MNGVQECFFDDTIANVVIALQVAAMGREQGESMFDLQMMRRSSSTDSETASASTIEKETAKDKFMSFGLERFDTLSYFSKCLFTSDLHSEFCRTK